MKETPSLALDKFYSVCASYVTAKGKQFGIPMEGPDSDVILLNSSLFKEAGLDPQGKGLKTWNDFAAAASKLTKRDASGNPTQAGWLVQDWSSIEGFSGWTYANGGKIQNADQTKALFDTKNAIGALDFQVGLLDKSKVSLPLSLNRNDSQLFMQGKTAMVQWGTWSPATIKDNAPSGFEYWMIPVPPGPLGKSPAVTTWTNMVVIPNKVSHPDVSWAFAKFFSSLTTQIERLKILDEYAPLKAFFTTPEWKAKVKELPVLGVVPKAAELGNPYPLFRDFTHCNDALGPLLQAVMLGKMQPSQALQQGAQKVDSILAQSAG